MNKDNINIEFSVLYPEFDDTVDYYKEDRDAFLEEKFRDYPNVTFRCFELCFSIRNGAKNAPLIYAVLEAFPEDLLKIDKNKIIIKIESEEELLKNIYLVSDVITIVKSWKTAQLRVNNVNIGMTTEFRFFTDVLFEKNNVDNVCFNYSITEIKKKYGSRRRTSSKVIAPVEAPIRISRDDIISALKCVVEKYICTYGKNKDIECHTISEYDRVVKIENSLIVDFRLIPRYWARENDEYDKDWDYPYIMIQELTHNELFKFNFAGFKRCFENDHIGIDFFKFRGLQYYRKEIDNFSTVDRSLPELKLIERLEKYPGETHHFIVLRMEDVNGKIVYGVGDTKDKVHKFVLKLCKELEDKNSRSLELNGASCLPFIENRDFVNAFLSWKGERKVWRLENKFAYYYEDRQVKNDVELLEIPMEIINSAKNGVYDKCEFGSYNKPLNRWKSEELVYNIVKKLYKEYQVIYQYKPFYLSTDGGNMSYDIYICGLKIAIEYQGKQHFEPVEFFGGVENYQEQQKRDKLKALRSQENGIKLIYVNYWEDITPELIKNKIENALL